MGPSLNETAWLLSRTREWENDVADDMKPVILTIDDDNLMQELVEDLLGDRYEVRKAGSAEAGLSILKTGPVDLILMDVEMPGMDGYTACRRIKEADSLAETPVIFVSAHDTIEARLKGYEAGGADYIIKPFDRVELETKISHLFDIQREHGQLKQMADYASRTAMTAMSSLGEIGVLIETMKRFNGCNDLSGLIEAMLEGIGQYGLQGAVQIRTGQDVMTRTETGEAPPLLVSVINHMIAMDRITHFHSRMCITYDHVSLLVNNMPEDDPDRCGRLRDHLAMMVEGADVRVHSILLSATLNRVTDNLAETLAGIDSAQRESHAHINLRLNALNDDIDRMMITLGLTETQEQLLSQTIRTGIDEILNHESTGVQVQNRLSTLIHELQQALR